VAASAAQKLYQVVLV